MKYFFPTLILIFNLIYIENAFCDQLKLKSDPPDATVSIRDLNGVQTVKIGKTPYEGNIADLVSNFAKSNFFLIVIEKAGFENQSILLSDLLKSDIELNINLVPKEDILLYRNIDKAIVDLFESQRLMRLGHYDDAIGLLKTLEAEQPKLSTIPEFVGSAYYLKKDTKGALSWYEKAYRLNPENKDAYSMKTYLRKALGGADDAKK